MKRSLVTAMFLSCILHTGVLGATVSRTVGIVNNHFIGVTDEFYDVSDQSEEKGYVVLSGKNSFASQVISENTIYDIRETFNLGDETVIIPAGCTLLFNGGSVNTGTLYCQGTTLEGFNRGVNCAVSGSLNNTAIKVSLFADYQNALDVASKTGTTLLIDKPIELSQSLNVSSRTIIEGLGGNAIIKMVSNKPIFVLGYKGTQQHYISIKNLHLIGGTYGIYSDSHESMIRCTFESIRFQNQSMAGFKKVNGGVGCCLFKNLIFENQRCKDGYISAVCDWYNDNDISDCTFLGHCPIGAVHICASQIDRNSISTCWFEDLLFEDINTAAIDVSINVKSPNQAHVIRGLNIHDNYFEKLQTKKTSIKGRAIMINSDRSYYSYGVNITNNTFTNLLAGSIYIKGMAKNCVIESNVSIDGSLNVVINDVTSDLLLNENRSFAGVCSEMFDNGKVSYTLLPNYDEQYKVYTWRDLKTITQNANDDHKYIEDNKFIDYYKEVTARGKNRTVTFDVSKHSISLMLVKIYPGAVETSYSALILVDKNTQSVTKVSEVLHGGPGDWSYLTDVTFSVSHSGGTTELTINTIGNLSGSAKFTYVLRSVTGISLF